MADVCNIAVPCQHIADYYQHRWEAHKCIGFNLLRHGYRQWSEGRAVYQTDGNNLYDVGRLMVDFPPFQLTRWELAYLRRIVDEELVGLMQAHAHRPGDRGRFDHMQKVRVLSEKLAGKGAPVPVSDPLVNGQ